MYSKTRIAFKYLCYLFTSASGKGHGVHSPFIYEFITRVLNDKAPYDAYAVAESLRNRMKRDARTVTVKDLGAGSAISATSRRTVASIARNAAKPKKFGQLLFRMARFYQPATILELGTSLGITTRYLSLAQPDAKIYTLEGVPEIARTARENFTGPGSENITLVEGNFDETLEPLLERLSGLDMAFIDGNHRQQPTENYFHALLTKSHNDTILVFDDIHWSWEMERAWETIRADPSVRCTIDLFFIGIVLFRKEFFEKQHFIIRY